MIRRYIPMLALPAALTAAAEGPTFDASFPRFPVPAAKILWAAPTNVLPPSLWVYKVTDQAFPTEVISNLMAMGSLTAKDKLSDPLLRYTTRDYSRYLIIDPAQGRIEYHNQDAQASVSDRNTHRPQPVEGVPNDAEAETLGLRLLKQFGIERSELAAKPGTSKLLTFGEKGSRSYFDKTRGVPVEDEVDTRGIFFNRRIDGINFAGMGIGGGCEAEFGNQGRVTNFKLNWRNLQRYERCKVAAPDEIIRRIREGKAVSTHRDLVNPADVKKITIISVAPLYMGASASERQEFVYPFAQLEATVDLGTTNSSLQLYCPLLK